ncbi:MAG: sigma 54-interacting transcriptional regulator [Desulfamplus sp.]|nr:sigma 54-interacting transcriptional regulator [Desulfamplus sp.]
MLSELGLLSLSDISDKNFSGLGWRTFSKALLNASPNGIAVLDINLNVILSNKLAQDSLELFPGSMLSPTLPELADCAKSLLNTREPIKGVVVKRNNSSYSIVLNPIMHENSLLGILCIIQDVTDIETVTSSMYSFKELSIELDTIIESSNDGLWICDGNGTVLRINPASERFTGVKSSDVVGRNMRDIVKEGLVDQSVTLEVLKTGKKANLIQKTRTGKELFLTGNPVFDHNGKLFRVVVNERDITEINELQRELDEKAALNAQYRQDLLEMQIEETRSMKIIAKTPEFMRIVQQAVKLGSVDSTILILGESGTGKGVIADLIHKYSSRSSEPMIKLNCGSIPESLVESELFGYEKGAFTGAKTSGKPGKFEMADKGVIFLDEVAELPLASQVKLLRFLEDGTITRVGGTTQKKVDVRIIAATNRDLKQMMEKKLFRSDLYYRLNVIPITMPPLRERKECIITMLHHFMEQSCIRYKKTMVTLSREALDALLSYFYPGNVRELINICERLVVLSNDGHITFDDLPSSVRASAQAKEQNIETGCDLTKEGEGGKLREIMERVEMRILQNALQIHGTQTLVANFLGLNQSTVGRKLKKYNLLR